MAKVTEVLAQVRDHIRAGRLDSQIDDLTVALNEIGDAIKERRRKIARRRIGDLQRGDFVQISGLRRGSTLNGMIAKVHDPKRTRCEVDIPYEAPEKYAGSLVTIPGACLTKVDEEKAIEAGLTFST